MKIFAISVAFIFLGVFYLSLPASAGPRYKHMLPELSDSALKQVVGHDMAYSSELIEPDKITAWLATATNLQNPESTRIYAIRRLFDYRQKRIERGLIPLLRDSSMRVRAEAARVLGKMKFPSSARVLIDALRFSYGRTSEEIQKSLKNITGQEFGTQYYTWMKWYKRNRREYR